MPNGNPIARNPLLGKGGVHKRSRSAERQLERDMLELAMDDWATNRADRRRALQQPVNSKT